MELLKQVEEVISLLVFENLSICPVKDFLGESQWLKTATEVNAAILSSFGKGNFLYSLSLSQLCYVIKTCTMLTSICCVCVFIGPKLQRLLQKLTMNQTQLDERGYEYPRMSDMSTGELVYPQE